MEMINSPTAMDIMDSKSGGDREAISSDISIKRRRTYIVTGGSGFLGSHIVEHLLNCDQNVIVLDNKSAPNDILCQIEQSAKSKFIFCDITQYNNVYRAFNAFKKERETEKSDSNNYNIECVFHCAALTDPWGPFALYEKVNVIGTTNIIRACIECNIRKLVHTSSSCVVLDGTDCQNGDESMNYVSKKNHLNAYSYSKQRAEEAILLANNRKCQNEKYKLLTCALRPHCVFGPRDTHFISQIIEKARDGKISHMIGEGHNITDFTYVDNVVYAHMLAAKSLCDNPNCVSAAGQVYFITNGEPTLFWSFLGAILQQFGCPRPTKYISYNVAYCLALLMEFIYMIIGWIFGWKPIITRQMVCMMASHRWFSHAKATRDLGYKPIVTLDHGIKKTVQFIKDKERNRNRDRYYRLQAEDDANDSHVSLNQMHNDIPSLD